MQRVTHCEYSHDVKGADQHGEHHNNGDGQGVNRIQKTGFDVVVELWWTSLHKKNSTMLQTVGIWSIYLPNLIQGSASFMSDLNRSMQRCLVLFQST